MIAIAVADETLRGRLVEALHEIDDVVELQAVEANRQQPALVVVDAGAVAVLERARDDWPTARRLVCAAYEDLPALLRQSRAGTMEGVLSRHALHRSGARVVSVVARALGREPGEPASPPEADAGRDALLRWTIARITELSTVYLRSPPVARAAPELQLVVPQNQELDRLRVALAERWSELARGRAGRKHAALRRFQRLSSDQTLFIEPSGQDGDEPWYLAILPWRDEPRVTLAFGIAAPASPEHHALIRALHQQASLELPWFPLPDSAAAPATTPARTSGDLRYLREYDWIVSPSYVGIDRRRRPTSFLNRYTLTGRRREVRVGPLRGNGEFVDRLPRGTLPWVGVFLVLSFLDLWLTWRHAGRGRLRELNPLLRGLLAHRLAFVVTKTSLALAAVLLAARIQTFRVGRALLAVMLFTSLWLIAYWAALLRR